MQQDLGNIKEWIRSNELRLNISQTNLTVYINRSSHCVFPSVYLENEVIQQVSQIKFLGAHVDEYLNWKT